MDFFPPLPPLPPLPGVTLTQSQGEVTPATGPCVSWPAELNQIVRQNWGGQMCTRTFTPGGGVVGVTGGGWVYHRGCLEANLVSKRPPFVRRHRALSRRRRCC